MKALTTIRNYRQGDEWNTVVLGRRTWKRPIERYVVASTATWAQPVISGNQVYVKDVGSLTLWTAD